MNLAWTWRRLLPALLVLHVSAAHAAEEPIRVGILHSQSGTMAISESVLKDTVLMLIADQNKKGGLLGRKLEPVIVDPASDWGAFTDKAYELLAKEKVAVVFGCWTSSSRKAVIPVFERFNGLLFYPVQYEGEESSRNVFYTGAAPSQQAIPAVRYLMSKEGGEIRRWVLLGTDYVYPRTTNRILSAYHDDLHAIRAFRLARNRCKDQGFRFGRKTDRGDLNHQRRREHAFLQGTQGPTGERQHASRDGALGRRARNARHWRERSGRPARGMELFPIRQLVGKRYVRENVGGLQRATGQDDK